MATMTYRHLPIGEPHQHCMWMDSNDMEGWIDADILRSAYKRHLMLSPAVVDWLHETAQDSWKAIGHGLTGMAVLFTHKRHAALFKLRWDRP